MAADPAPPPSTTAGTRSVDAVVVAHDSAEHLPACLDALLAQTHDVRVVVVDNASRDGSVGLARSAAAAHADRVTVLVNERNEGFSGAVNRAVAGSDAWAVLLVNPDAVLDPDHVAHLVGALAADDTLGSVQGTLWRPTGPGEARRVDSTGHRAYRSRLFGNRDEGRTTPSPGGEVFGVTGAAALHRRAMLDDVAVPRPDGSPEWLDETLFAFWDDVDLDWRARLRGWRAAHVPAAEGVHERGGAGPRRTALVEECNAANRLLVVAKLDDRRALGAAAPQVVLGTALKLLWLAVQRPGVLPGVLRRLRTGWAPTRRRRVHALATATVAPATVVGGFERFDWRSWVRRWWDRTRSAPTA